MTETSIARSLSRESSTGSIFEKPVEGISLELIAFLKLAEREGVYSRLTPQRRDILEKYVVRGLTMEQIAMGLGITRHTVSQSLRLSPKSMYRDMIQDVLNDKTQISFSEIETAYKAFKQQPIARRRTK